MTEEEAIAKLAWEFCQRDCGCGVLEGCHDKERSLHHVMKVLNLTPAAAAGLMSGEWEAVPRKPTAKMIKRGKDAWLAEQRSWPNPMAWNCEAACYRAMLAAAKEDAK